MATRVTRWIVVCLLTAAAPAAERPLIFPEPQKLKILEDGLTLNDGIPVLLPEHASDADTSLARMLAAELSDRYGISLKINQVQHLPNTPFILIGDVTNPLVRQQRIEPPSKTEAYALQSSAAKVVVAGRDEEGAFYGMQSLRQLITRQGNRVYVPAVEVEDWPHLPFRGIRLYLPGHENIAFFKRFLRDFMALYKFNKVILEVNASMRLERHPEINAGWIDFARDLYYTQRYFPLGPRGAEQTSAHHDTADGEILEKEEVADLVRYAKAQHVEVIPEIPTFTHSYYLLTRHKNLGAITGAEWPDIYDPSNPEVYKLVFDVIDEYIEVIRPKMVHIGHDEMFFPVEACPTCQKRDPALLYADDIRRLHDHLAAKGIRTAMYGDHLVESVRGVHRRPAKSETGWEYTMPGALTQQQVKDLIPKDILIANWFWQDSRAAEGRGEPTEILLAKLGFQQVHANFTPSIDNYGRRTAGGGSIIGGAPSSWAATTEYTFGKDLMMDFLGTANLMWSTHWPAEEHLSKIVQSLMPGVRRRLHGHPLPSEDGDAPESIGFGKAGVADAGITIQPGRIGNFDVQTPIVVAVTAKPAASAPIPIGADVSSILFLHASTKPAANDMSYRFIHNFPDTADLLGWYEVLYQDGFVDTVPVRFGWNILPLTWGEKSDAIAKGSVKELSYAYAADALSIGNATLFAYEWVNPRFGKTIKEVRLRSAAGFIDAKGKPSGENAVVLAAISVVKKRQPPPVTAVR